VPTVNQRRHPLHMGQILEVEKRIDAQVDFGSEPRTFSDRPRWLGVSVGKYTKVDDKAAFGHKDHLGVDLVLAWVKPAGLLFQQRTRLAVQGIELQRKFRPFVAAEIFVVTVLNNPGRKADFPIAHASSPNFSRPLPSESAEPDTHQKIMQRLRCAW